MHIKPSCGVVVLAAGKGKRMLSNTAKVLQPLLGQPLLYYILNQIHHALPDAQVAIVVGHGKDAVENAVKSLLKSSLKSFNHTLDFIHQPDQKGTGDALRCVMESNWGKAHVAHKTPLLVLPGDMPLIPSQLIQQMASPLKGSEALRLLTCHHPQPQGYGRIIRANEGISHIVEERDASENEKKIKEIGVSTYLFDSEFLAEKIPLLSNQNAQGEYYLTDLISIASKSMGPKSVTALTWDQAEDLQGINDPWDLAEVSGVLSQTILKQLAKKGVRLLGSRNIFIESTVEIEEGVVIYPGVTLEGQTYVKKGAILVPGVYLKNVEVGENSELKAGTIAEQSKIEADTKIGPYAHLRPNSYVGNSAKIGNFVELKNTQIGEHTSVAHLSYLGDADVGKNVNIGCGFVTCNFDGRIKNGRRKHPTVIEDDAFVGSDCQAIAPIRIGKGAYIASGSTLTDDVPPESLAIARSKQVNKEGYARRLRNDKENK